MAHITADRVVDSTTTTGTGTLTLANAAPTGFRSFGSVCANGDTCLYAVSSSSGAEWEVGVGTYSTTGPTLARTTVLSSSNAGVAVAFSAGSKDVFLTAAADRMARVDIDGHHQPRRLSAVDLTAATANPAAPADGVTLFARSVGGRTLLAQSGPSGLDTSFQPILARNAVQFWNAVGGAATVPTAIGAAAISATGTATTLAVTGTTFYNSIRMLEYLVTTAATTAVAGFRAGVNSYIRGNVAGTGGFFFVCRVGIATAGTLSTRRFFCGLTSQTAVPTDVEPSTNTTLANVIGIGADAGDTNYQFMTKTGTGTATKVDTGIAKAASGDRIDVLEIAMFAPPGASSVSWQLSKLNTATTAVGSTGSTLPAATTALGPLCYSSVGGTSSVVGVAIKLLYLETDS